MSINPLWARSHQQAATAHFYSKVLPVPWEFGRELDGDKVSLTFLKPTYRVISRLEHEVTFIIRLVCTVSTDGLYDLSDLSGQAAALLEDSIITEDICAKPDGKEVEINLFDFKHGYKQSLMEKKYTSRLRG